VQYTSSLDNPLPAIMVLNNLPESPIRGIPIMYSSCPGASATNTTSTFSLLSRPFSKYLLPVLSNRIPYRIHINPPTKLY
jgi:hypothetical protein